jgi:hypothetical protein
VAQGEEEQSLLLAHDVVLDKSPIVIINNATVAPSSPPTAPHRVIHILEQQVFGDLGPTEENDHSRWVLDTGATNHTTRSRDIFAELDSKICGTVKFGDDSIEGRGIIILTCKDGGHRTLTGVYFILRLKASIMSLEQLDETGCRINIDRGMLRIYDEHGHLLTKVPRKASRLYYLKLHIERLVCLATHATEVAWQWHTRYGNFGSLRKLAVQKMVRGLPELTQVERVCDGCLIGKQRHTPFPAQAKRRAESVLELIGSDLCGPVTPATPSGNKYFLLLVDDMSRYMWLRFLSSKD